MKKVITFKNGEKHILHSSNKGNVLVFNNPINTSIKFGENNNWEKSSLKKWLENWWEEYGVKVKRIRHCYNPFNSWGFLTENYIVYYWVGSMHGDLLANYDVIFHSPEQIVKFLESQKKK